MIIRLIIILLTYFVIGAILTGIVNQKNQQNERENWLKFILYFFIIATLFSSIFICPLSFHYLSILILAIGFFEIAYWLQKKRELKMAFVAIPIYSLIACGFYLFSKLDQEYLFYTLMLVVAFDGYSQLIGQLFGDHLIAPNISPRKTYEGLLGGIFLTIITALLIRKLTNLSLSHTVLMALGVALSSFLGDILASFFKRKLGIKDFSRLIPGHGGFLDRFDSWLLSGCFVLLVQSL